MRRWAPFLWYGLIFATSSTVVGRTQLVHAVPGPAQADFNQFWSQTWWLFVKGWHATEFAILYLLIRRALDDEGWSFFFVLMAAVLDEFHQTFVPGRGGIVSDVLIDFGGAFVAAILWKWRSAPRPSTTSPLCRP